MTPEEWAKIKKTGSANKMDFTDFSFQGEILTGFQFQNCIFDNVNFQNTTFNKVSFQGEDTVFSDNLINQSTWEHVVFQVSIIESCKFTESDLNKCVFQNAVQNVLEMKNNSFAGSNCQKLTFQNVEGISEDFSHTVLESCVFQACSYEYSTFFRCHASGCAWAKVSMVNATFDEADLSGINLNGYRCSGEKSSFRKAKLTGTVWDKPQAREMNFSGADLSHAVWKGGNFQKSNFTGAVFDNADFSEGSNFRSATMSNASMYQTNFEGAQMGAVKASKENAADLSGAYMEEANFSEADLYNVNLAGCAWYTTNAGGDRPIMAQKTKLDQANLSGAFLMGLDLGQATLTGANFDRSILCNANFSGANLGLSAEGRRVSFSDAWLLGCDFLECRMNVTIFSDASVMFLDGPYFQLPAEDASLLDTGIIPEGYPDIFSAQNRSIDADASLVVVRKGKLWQLKNPKGKVNRIYILHFENNAITVRGGVIGVPLFSVESRYAEELEKGQMPEDLRKLFSQKEYPLPEKVSVKVKEPGRLWLISHLMKDSGSCFEEYNLVKGQDEILCYGYTPVLSFPKGTAKKERDIFICDHTRLFPEDFDPESVCPNGERFSEYPKRRTFEELMRAAYPAKY